MQKKRLLAHNPVEMIHQEHKSVNCIPYCYTTLLYSKIWGVQIFYNKKKVRFNDKMETYGIEKDHKMPFYV